MSLFMSEVRFIFIHTCNFPAAASQNQHIHLTLFMSEVRFIFNHTFNFPTVAYG